MMQPVIYLFFHDRCWAAELVWCNPIEETRERERARELKSVPAIITIRTSKITTTVAPVVCLQS
jgi:hypothetical protein